MTQKNIAIILEYIKKYWLDAIIVLTGLVFAAAGIGRWSGSPEMHQSFAQLGLPDWFGYFIGACEIAGALGLLIRRISALAAAGLAINMIGAVYYHILYDLETITLSMVLLIVTIFIFTRRRTDLSLRLRGSPFQLNRN